MIGSMLGTLSNSGRAIFAAAMGALFALFAVFGSTVPGGWLVLAALSAFCFVSAARRAFPETWIKIFGYPDP